MQLFGLLSHPQLHCDSQVVSTHKYTVVINLVMSMNPCACFQFFCHHQVA